MRTTALLSCLATAAIVSSSSLATADTVQTPGATGHVPAGAFLCLQWADARNLDRLILDNTQDTTDNVQALLKNPDQSCFFIQKIDASVQRCTYEAEQSGWLRVSCTSVPTGTFTGWATRFKLNN